MRNIFSAILITAVAVPATVLADTSCLQLYASEEYQSETVSGLDLRFATQNLGGSGGNGHGGTLSEAFDRSVKRFSREDPENSTLHLARLCTGLGQHGKSELQFFYTVN